MKNWDSTDWIGFGIFAVLPMAGAIAGGLAIIILAVGRAIQQVQQCNGV